VIPFAFFIALLVGSPALAANDGTVNPHEARVVSEACARMMLAAKTPPAHAEDGSAIAPKSTGYTSAERERLQLEALDLEAAWVYAHDGRLPRQADYGSKEGQIPLNYAKLNGGKVAVKAGLHIFSSADSHRAALLQRCDSLGIGYESR